MPKSSTAFFSAYDHFETWLAQKGMFHVELGLERLHAAIDRLGQPEFPIIQVLGTNGKGSTSAFLASLAQAHSLHTGLYLSPHFLSLRERVIFNGELIPEGEWLEAANTVYAHTDANDLTYFEFLTLLAAQLFRQKNADLAIFEAGLGGRSDATTALPAIGHCFTPIAMDHAAIIGPTIRHIAADKAAAIKNGAAVFSAPQFAPVQAILQRQCVQQSARLQYAPALQNLALYRPRLNGHNQIINAGLALQAWQWFARQSGIAADEAKIAHGLANAFLPGRMQHLKAAANLPELLLDGGHNPHAIQSLLNGLAFRPQTVIYSALRDKDWQSCLSMLLSALPNAIFYLPQLDSERAAKVEEMAAYVNETASGRARAFYGPQALKKALACAPGPALVCGSLYLLADFYALFPQFLEQFSTRIAN